MKEKYARLRSDKAICGVCKTVLQHIVYIDLYLINLNQLISILTYRVIITYVVCVCYI